MEKISWKAVGVKFWEGIKVLFHLVGSIMIMYYGMTFMAKFVVPMEDILVSLITIGTIVYFVIIFSWKPTEEFFTNKSLNKTQEGNNGFN